MSKNKIAPKGMPKYLVTTKRGVAVYASTQAEAKKNALRLLDRGEGKVHMFKVAYDFFEAFK